MYLDPTPEHCFCNSSFRPPASTLPPSFTRVSKILPGHLLHPRMLAFKVLTIRWKKKSMSGHWGAARTEEGASRARPGSDDTAPDWRGDLGLDRTNSTGPRSSREPQNGLCPGERGPGACPGGRPGRLRDAFPQLFPGSLPGADGCTKRPQQRTLGTEVRLQLAEQALCWPCLEASGLTHLGMRVVLLASMGRGQGRC